MSRSRVANCGQENDASGFDASPSMQVVSKACCTFCTSFNVWVAALSPNSCRSSIVFRWKCWQDPGEATVSNAEPQSLQDNVFACFCCFRFVTCKHAVHGGP